MIFYAPARALREVRDRAPLAPIALMALGSQLVYLIVIQLLAGNRAFLLGGPIAVIHLLFHFSGFQAAYVTQSLQNAAQLDTWVRFSPAFRTEMQNALSDSRVVAGNLFRSVKWFFFAVTAVISVGEVFRVSVLRALAISVVGLTLAIFISPLWTFLLSPILASPFLLLILFILIRGYLSGVMRSQRA